MSHILKFGAAAENIGNLEFLTLGDAVAHWGNNLLDTGSGGYRQTDHVVFLQVGAVVHNNTAITLPFAGIDSQGFDFVVTNPQNHNWTRTNSATTFINFNNYKCANVVFNRIHLGYSTNNATAISGIPAAAGGTYHAADNDLAIRFYNCVMAALSGSTSFSGLLINSSVSNIRTVWHNNIIIGLSYYPFGSAGGVPVLHPPRIENNTIVSGGSLYFGNVPGTVLQNNIFCMLSTPTDVAGDNINSTQNLLGEIPKNILANAPQNATVAAVIDPSRAGRNAFLVKEMFNRILPSTLADGITWANTTYFPVAIGGNMHALVEAMTPNNEVMKNIIQPETRVANPLRYLINGWDSQGNEQYGACGYNWQEHFFTGLIATDLGDHTVRLDWNIPTAGVPSSYTKWGIYKVYAPRSEDLVNWLERTRYKVGEVPRNVNTFVDTGADYSNASGADMTYRVILER